MKRLVQILILSRDPLLIDAASVVLADARRRTAVEVAGSAAQALTCLNAAHQSPAGTPASLVVVDLLLGPECTGFIETIKQNHDLRFVPVIALCPPDQDRVAAAYEQHANCLLLRPDEPAALVALMMSVRDFWLTVVKLPRRGPKQ